jgi:transcription elongation GreA/GreB family factor
MTSPEKLDFKSRLKLFCKSQIEQRIAAAQSAMALAQLAANSEEKSSAGDKYETGRAMAHREKDMMARQLAENVKELALLQSVDMAILYKKVEAGACVETTHGFFFLAAGLGRQDVDGQAILFLSPFSPLAKMLLGKVEGDEFHFNRLNARINHLY